MRYFVFHLNCLLLLLFVTSTFASSQPIGKLEKSKTKNNRSTSSRLTPSSSVLRCGDHITRIGERSKKTKGKNRVIGGIPVYPGQFPYAVRFRSWDEAHNTGECGGVIIGDRWILTAAHCVQSVENDFWFSKPVVGEVIYGDYSIRQADDGAKGVWVDDVRMHPDYNDTVLDNDIAVVRTKESIKFDLKEKERGYGAVNSICLPSRNYETKTPREDWFFAGWGMKSLTDRSDTMRYYKVNLIDYSYCTTLWGDNSSLTIPDFNPEHKICTFNERGNTYFGDSGYGLVRILNNGRYELVGLASYGPKEGRKGANIFVNVFNYLDWIREKIK